MELSHVLIFDEHPLIRAGVVKVLTGMGGKVVQQAASSAELRESLEKETPDLLIVGLASDDADRIARIRAQNRGLALLVLGSGSDQEAGVRAILDGASGYLSKRADPAELVEAVQQLANGGRYISLELGAALADYAFDGVSDKASHENLSSREYTVLLSIATGLTTAKIAEQLKLSPKTVGTYRARLLEKMGIGTTAQLTRYVVENGLEQRR